MQDELIVQKDVTMPKPGQSQTKKKKLGYALLSVSDKTNITEMAKCLVELGFEIISTGGTARTLKEKSVPVTHVSKITGFPEIMDGRVKTLHPKVHGGLLGKRDNKSHCMQAEENGIKWIDLIIVNLYPFEKTIEKKNVSIEEAIENIDIGGPSMIRSAAKNYQYVTVIVDPLDYRRVLEEINIRGTTLPETRKRLAVKAFSHTARYDAAIDTFLSRVLLKKQKLYLAYDNGETLRYGENPHQRAVFYKTAFHEEKIPEPILAGALQLHGKQISFNNIVDGAAALEAVKELSGSKGCVIVKHTNPCGFAIGKTLEEAFEMAWAGDPVSAYGSVIAVTDVVDVKTAKRLTGRFVEILMAPDFNSGALEFLKKKSKDIRLLKLPPLKSKIRKKKIYKHVLGGLLEQDRDIRLTKKMELVTHARFPESKLKLAKFAYQACKHVKSNAIVIAYEYRQGYYMVLGMGAGQPNRVDAIRKLCATKAEENIKFLYEKKKPDMPLKEYKNKISGECVLASDAFFPFDDNIRHAHHFGIKYIIQPGGSKRDNEVIDACNRFDVAMLFTGTRHFKH
jgi:phosphoribosylaminoimidazolecarboxamide formyltransferase/IMP cyclohydrolase